MTLGFIIGEFVSAAINIAGTNRVLKMPLSLIFDRVATLAIGSMAISAASGKVETHGAVLALLACALTAMLLEASLGGNERPCCAGGRWRRYGDGAGRGGRMRV